MPIEPVTYAIPDNVPCFFCGAETSTFTAECPSCRKGLLRLDIGDFTARAHDRQIVDVRNGGLVLGREERVDDIPMFDFAGKNVLQAIGMMQGMEFIVSTVATEKHRGLLEQLNADKGDASTLPDPDWGLSCNVFDTRLANPLSDLWHYAGVWVARQFIINRYATKKHWRQLVAINADV